MQRRETDKKQSEEARGSTFLTCTDDKCQAQGTSETLLGCSRGCHALYSRCWAGALGWALQECFRLPCTAPRWPLWCLPSRRLKHYSFPRSLLSLPGPRAGGSWFPLSMLVMFPARGSALWSGCAELHGRPSWRMLLIFWEYRVLLQRVPGAVGLQTSVLEVRVPLCCRLRQPPARNGPPGH